MDFGLTEEQEMLQETVRGFVNNECPPTRLREIFDANTGHDVALWSGLAEMGLTGLVIPEEYGGAEMELLELALVAEVLGEGCVPGPFLGHSLAAIALLEAGSDAQKKKWLPLLASGEKIAGLAIAEAGSLWEPADWKVDYRDGRIHGEKLFVPNADVCDVLVVGCAGGRFALVERSADRVALENMGGIDQSRPIFKLTLDNVPAEGLEGGKGASERVRDVALGVLAADSFGVASGLVQMSSEFAKTRIQFGMSIAQFQGVKHQLARLATDIEPTRALYWYAAHALDHLPEESSLSAALAKSHICDRAMETARQAVELYGGIGFTWECDVQMWFKRAMFNRAAFGTPDILRERIATLGGW